MRFLIHKLNHPNSHNLQQISNNKPSHTRIVLKHLHTHRFRRFQHNHSRIILSKSKPDLLHHFNNLFLLFNYRSLLLLFFHFPSLLIFLLLNDFLLWLPLHLRRSLWTHILRFNFLSCSLINCIQNFSKLASNMTSMTVDHRCVPHSYPARMIQNDNLRCKCIRLASWIIFRIRCHITSMNIACTNILHIEPNIVPWHGLFQYLIVHFNTPHLGEYIGWGKPYI